MKYYAWISDFKFEDGEWLASFRVTDEAGNLIVKTKTGEYRPCKKQANPVESALEALKKATGNEHLEVIELKRDHVNDQRIVAVIGDNQKKMFSNPHPAHNVHDLTDAVFSRHASKQCAFRNLSETAILTALAGPDEVRPVREGRIVAHKTVMESGKPYLLRIFVDVDRKPPEIATVYKTGKIDKYRSMQ